MAEDHMSVLVANCSAIYQTNPYTVYGRRLGWMNNQQWIADNEALADKLGIELYTMSSINAYEFALAHTKVGDRNPFHPLGSMFMVWITRPANQHGLPDFGGTMLFQQRGQDNSPVHTVTLSRFYQHAISAQLADDGVHAKSDPPGDEYHALWVAKGKRMQSHWWRKRIVEASRLIKAIKQSGTDQPFTRPR